MASVYPRGGRWWHSYKNKTTGKRVQEPLGEEVKTKAQARAVSRQIVADHEERRASPAGFETLETVVEAFLANRKERREAWTWISYRKHLRPLLERHGDLPIGEVTDAKLEAHLRARIDDDGISKVTANKELVTFRVFWTWACKRRRARENPAILVDPYSARPKPRTPPTLELLERALEDLRALAADGSTRTWIRKGVTRERKARPEDRFAAGLYADVLVLVSWTGARLGELCRLAPDTVDVDRADATLLSSQNKGPRIVPLAPAALEIVKRRLAERERMAKELAKAGKEPPDDRLLLTHEGRGAERALNLFGKGWREDRPEFKLVVPHGIRHLVADRLRAEGVDPIIRARLLGHATIQMHAHYSHEGMDELRAAVNALGSAASRKAAHVAPAPAASGSPPSPRPSARARGSAPAKGRRPRA